LQFVQKDLIIILDSCSPKVYNIAYQTKIEFEKRAIVNKYITLSVVLVLIFALSACGETNGESSAVDGVLTIEQIKDNPYSFLGDVIITGIVDYGGTHNFILRDEARTFELPIDYRGNQALPQAGDEITIEGSLVDNCCGEGILLRAMQYELAGER